MPRYQKNSKVEHWRCTPDWQDSMGATHHGTDYFEQSLWACVQGRDYSEQYAIGAHWGERIVSMTVTRPNAAPGLGDHIMHDGAWFEVVTINDLTGRVGADMKLICKMDANWEPRS